jgi:hypothetical protein
MSSLDSTTTNTNLHTNQTNNIIIFECSDVRRDTDLILLKRTKSNNDNDENKFELH